MKIFLRLSLMVVVFSLSTNLGFAQAEKFKNAKTKEERAFNNAMLNEQSLQQRQAALNDLQENRYNYIKPDPSIVKRREFVRNLEELNIRSKELLLATRVESLNEKSLKEIASLANKLGKAAKELRKNLDLKGRKDQEDNTELSFDKSPGHLLYLSAKVSGLVKAVNKTQQANSVDASEIEQTEQKLQDIEKLSKTMKLLASKK